MSTNAIPEVEAGGANERATPAEREQRLVQIAERLLEGKPRREIVAALMSDLRLSRRSAQGYVHEAQRRIAAEAAEEETVYYLRLSQHQRDELLASVLRCTQSVTQIDPKTLRGLTSAIGAACRLLDGRNATAERLHKLTSPPAGAAAEETAKAIREIKQEMDERYQAQEREFEELSRDRSPHPFIRNDPNAPPLPSKELMERMLAGGPGCEAEQQVRAMSAAREAYFDKHPCPFPSDEPLRRRERRRQTAKAAKSNSPRRPPDGGPPFRSTHSPSSPRPRDELERQFFAAADAQVLPPVAGQRPKSMPDREMGRIANAIEAGA